MTSYDDTRQRLAKANPVADAERLLDDHVLADRFARIAQEVETMAATRTPLREVPSAPPTRRRRLRPVLAFAAGFALVVAALGAVALLRDPMETIPTAPPATGAPTTVAPSTTPLTAAGPSITWTRVADQDSFENGVINRVAVGESALIAVGTVWESSYPDDWVTDVAIWTSPDGSLWHRVSDSDFIVGDGRDQALSGVVAGPLGFIAVGSDQGANGSVWVSPDGRDWSRADDGELGSTGGQFPLGIVTGGPGLVAVGGGDTDALVWVSTDGLVWDSVDSPSLKGSTTDGPVLMLAAATGPDLLVGVGMSGFTDGDVKPAVWASETGLDWERLPDSTGAGDDGIEIGNDSPYRWVTMNQVVAIGDGFVAIGEDGDQPAAWRSLDGRTWDRVSVPDGFPSIIGATIAVVGERVVVVGAHHQSFVRPGAPAVMASDDSGLTWYRVEETGLLTGLDPETEFEISSVIEWGGRLLAVGRIAEGPYGVDRGAVWVGEWSD